MTVRCEAIEVSGGRILQSDMESSADRMRVICAHVNPAWTLVALRTAFSGVRRRSLADGLLCSVGGASRLMSRCKPKGWCARSSRQSVSWAHA